MFPFGPDVNVPRAEILMPEPRYGADKGFTVPDTRNHDRFALDCIGLKETYFEYIAAHRSDLRLDRASCAIACRCCSHVQVPLKTRGIWKGESGRRSEKFSIRQGISWI